MNSPPEARYPSGKGEVCKTFMRRFDPDPRLQNYPLQNQCGFMMAVGEPAVLKVEQD